VKAHALDLDVDVDLQPGSTAWRYRWRCSCGRVGPWRVARDRGYGRAATSARRGGQRHVAAKERR